MNAVCASLASVGSADVGRARATIQSNVVGNNDIGRVLSHRSGASK